MRRRKSLRRFKKQEMNLEINSLLDILVILLVFLIKNYSATNVELNIPKELTLPISKSATENNVGVSISLDKNYELYLGESNISILNEDEKGLIQELFDELLVEKSKIDNLAMVSGGKSTEIVNIMVDENIPYSFIKRIMFTSKEAGFKEFKFVVTQ